MIWLWLVLILPSGTPHFTTLNWPYVMVTDTYLDGEVLTRPAFGYHVWRAEVVNGIQGPFLLLNPDVLVLGQLDGDGNPANGEFIDEQAVEGSSYVYAVSAVDFGGESALSPVSDFVTVPVNPNAPSNLQSTVH